jgi:N-acetyl-gamma-glutamyl-phosphate reductase/acetylglutamate kinase
MLQARQMSDAKSVAQQLLKAIGSQQEIDQYIDLYSKASQFALIKVGGDCIAHQLDELSPALSFLHHVGLRPIVVHGAGPQMNALIEKQGVRPHHFVLTI